MCGIVGQLHHAGNDRPSFEAMVRTLAHRGPDDEGIFEDPAVRLGIRRLSIIDLAHGHQPMANEDRTVWVVCNGQIYNYRELRAGLQQSGHVFHSSSDTEVIVHLYEEHGFDFVSRLEGMFALALWDARSQRLVLARDRFGIKPLYYTQIKESFLFASELKALLAHPQVRRELDLTALDTYLTTEYIPSNQCIFRGIEKVPAASLLLIEDSAVSLKRYWQLDCTPVRTNEEEAGRRLRFLLEQSLARHLQSDVPVGFFLSGGLDSSALVALARASGSDPIRTFSVGFEEPSFDESRYSRFVSQRYHTEHTHRMFTASELLRILPRIGQGLDEPLGDGSIFPFYLLSESSRSRITVALSGEGADELFAGYPTYQAHQASGLYRRLPLFLRRYVLEPAIRALPTDYRNISLDFAAKQFIRAAALVDPFTRHRSWMGSFDESEKGLLFAPQIRDALRQSRSVNRPGIEEAAGAQDLLTRVQLFDLFGYLQDDLLVKADRVSMMNSQEVRVPYLDRELVEFVFSLPAGLRMKRWVPKYLFKRSLQPVLPRRIIARRKKGFGMPVGFWLLDAIQAPVDELLHEGRLRQQGLFEPGYVRRLLAEHRRGVYDHRKKLWTLFMFQLWYDHHLNET